MRSTCAPAYTCVAARTEAADGINQADRQDMVAAHSHDAGSNMLSRGISDSALLCECSAQLSWITGVHVVAGAIPTMLSENVSAHRDIHVRLSTHDRKLGNALTIKACSSPQHQFFHLMTPTICAQYGCGRIGSLYSAQGDRVASDRCGSSVEAPLPGTPHPRQRKALDSVALIRRTTEELIAKCREMVDAEEQVPTLSWCLSPPLPDSLLLMLQQVVPCIVAGID